MSDRHVFAHVRAAAEEAIGASAGRAFEKDAERFLEILRRVPDHPPQEVTDEDVADLLTIVDRVVDAIEDRVTSEHAAAAQQRLVEIVYAIRATMEEIDRWHRHYR